MKGEEHMLITITSIGIIIYPFIKAELVMPIVFGAMIGSLIPDIDAHDSLIFHKKPKLRAFGYIGKYFIYKPSIMALKVIFPDVKEEHRGFLHSIPGIIILTLLTSAYILTVSYIMNIQLLYSKYFLAFIASYFAGNLFHLIEDCTTLSGVRFFYPFSRVKVRGRLRTGHSISIGIFAFSLTLIALYKLIYLQTPYLITLSILIISWLIFLFPIARITKEIYT